MSDNEGLQLLENLLKGKDKHGLPFGLHLGKLDQANWWEVFLHSSRSLPGIVNINTLTPETGYRDSDESDIKVFCLD